MNYEPIKCMRYWFDIMTACRHRYSRNDSYHLNIYKLYLYTYYIFVYNFIKKLRGYTQVNGTLSITYLSTRFLAVEYFVSRDI